jgi:protein phosphatase
MTAAVIHGNTLHVANVGDSRTYLMRNGQLTQLTRDHTLTQQKLARGLIRPDQVEMDPDRSVLTRSMGAGPTVQVDVFPPQQLGSGDAVLLCSDGLTDMVGDQEIARLLDRHGPKRAVKKLIDTANKNGGFDNISVIVAQAGGKSASGGGLLAGLGGLAGSIGDLSKQQKFFVGGGAVLVAAALCGMTALGWSMSNRDKPTKTPAPAATTPAMTVTVPAVTATAPAETPIPQTTTTKPAVAATSTAMPTNTPTNTPLPDRDGDGVLDQQDRCAGQPGVPEFDGCPDDDGDGFPEAGFPDKQDQCPGEPGPVNGCPDSDGDGIPDHEDNCKDQPGPKENGGCPTGGGGGDDDDNNNDDDDDSDRR